MDEVPAGIAGSEAMNSAIAGGGSMTIPNTGNLNKDSPHSTGRTNKDRHCNMTMGTKLSIMIGEEEISEGEL